MSINPYLLLRQKLAANQEPARHTNGKRYLYDKSTLLREATMAKAGQIQTLQKAAEAGDKNAQQLYAQRKAEFDDQLRTINELDQLKSYQFKNQIEQLRQCFIQV
jgi:hypothetical protein